MRWDTLIGFYGRDGLLAYLIFLVTMINTPLFGEIILNGGNTSKCCALIGYAMIFASGVCFAICKILVETLAPSEIRFFRTKAKFENSIPNLEQYKDERTALRAQWEELAVDSATTALRRLCSFLTVIFLLCLIVCLVLFALAAILFF